MKCPIGLTPITRFSMTLDRESEIEQGSIFDEGMRQRYIERKCVAEEKRDKVFGGLFVIDAVLAFIVTGSSLNIPYFNIETNKIPAVLEAATILSSLWLLFSIAAFNNCMVYDQIIHWFSKKKAANGIVDPDFIAASESNFDFFDKLFRVNFHVSGFDFYGPGRAFVVAANTIRVMLFSVFSLFPILHYILIYNSISISIQDNAFTVGYIIYYSIVFLVGIVSILVAALPWIEFKFMADTDVGVTVRKRANRLGG